MLANIAGIALSTFTLAGLGIVFGGKQIFEERGRQKAMRQARAKQLVRQFLDDVQFHVSKDMRDLARELQRSIRDHYTERIAELNRTYTQSVESLQKTVRSSEAEQSARRQELTAVLDELQSIKAAMPSRVAP